MAYLMPSMAAKYTGKLDRVVITYDSVSSLHDSSRDGWVTCGNTSCFDDILDTLALNPKCIKCTCWNEEAFTNWDEVDFATVWRGQIILEPTSSDMLPAFRANIDMFMQRPYVKECTYE